MKQITHTANGSEFLLCDVPEGTKKTTIVEPSHDVEPGTIQLCCTIPFPSPMRGFKLQYFTLPPGQWELLGLAQDLSEDQAVEIVEMDVSGGFKCYADDLPFGCQSATISLTEPCESHGLKPEQTVILKQVKQQS